MPNPLEKITSPEFTLALRRADSRTNLAALLVIFVLVNKSLDDPTKVVGALQGVREALAVIVEE